MMNQETKTYVNWKGYRKYLKWMGIFWGLALVSSIVILLLSTQKATGFVGNPLAPLGQVVQFFFWSIIGLIWVLFFGFFRFILGKPLQSKDTELTKKSKRANLKC